MTEQECVAYELSEDTGKILQHKLNARRCIICKRMIRPGNDARVYTRPKRHKSTRRKAVMCPHHYQPSEKEDSMAGAAIKDKLVTYLRQHPGIDVYAADIMDVLGETRGRVMSGMASIRNQNLRNSEAIKEFGRCIDKRGTGVWRYLPPDSREQTSKRSDKRLFTEVGPTKDGSLVLECEDGKLFLANEM